MCGAGSAAGHSVFATAARRVATKNGPAPAAAAAGAPAASKPAAASANGPDMATTDTGSTSATDPNRRRLLRPGAGQGGGATLLGG